MHEARAWVLSVSLLGAIGWALIVWLWMPGSAAHLVPSALAHRVVSVALSAALLIALFFETATERTR